MLLSLLFSLLFAGDLLIPGRSLYRWDTLLYNWPVLAEARAQFLAGRMPFWASSFCCGTPLLANINAGVLYPPRVVSWILPTVAGYHLFLFLHVWLSLFGMAWFCRRGLRVPALGAWVGALAYAASGYARGMWDTHNFVALPWIPLGLLAVLGAARGRLLWPVLWGSICWSMLVLCGDFQSACLWVPAAALLSVMMPQRRRMLAALALIVALGALLSAAQWMPAMVARAESYRAGGLPFAEAVERSLNPVRLIELLIPHAFGTREGWFGGSLAGEGARKLLPWAASVHVGRVALLAALAGWFCKRHRPAVRWGGALFVISLFLSFGRFLPGYSFWMKLPLLGAFRYPEKYVLWSTIGLAVVAAHGVGTLAAMMRRGRWRGALRKALLGSGAAVVLAAILVSLMLPSMSGGAFIGMHLWKLWAGVLIVLVLYGVMGWSPWWRRSVRLLALVVAVDALAAWWMETPTTAAFDPLATPVVAQTIRASDHQEGRFVRDPAIQGVPMGPRDGRLTGSKHAAALQRAMMEYNSPRLWGIRCAGGFSPLESGKMQAFRAAYGAPLDGSVPPVPDFSEFCRKTAATWVLTTEKRAAAFTAAGLESVTEEAWGPPQEQTVLLRIIDAPEAAVLADAASVGRVPRVWRARPGCIRVDLAAGGAAELTVRESYAAGWRAADEDGMPLEVASTDEGFIRVSVPEDVVQVRLSYKPAGWAMGLLMSVAGLVVLTASAVMRNRSRARRVLSAPAVAAVACCVLFGVFGVGARTQWACVFDEGYHIARGVARLRSGDSRMSYFHPPLQNVVCAYFGNLAFGDRIRLPAQESWKDADIEGYSTDFASANAAVYPELIRASRWGSLLFGMLLVGVGTLWAGRAAGGMAALLAGLGLALNPTMLAHCNLTTTDGGVAALVVAGTYFLWRFTSGERRAVARRDRELLCAGVAFALAACVKFSGIVWLAAYVVLCVPLLAWSRRRGRLLWYAPATIGLSCVFLLCLYGLAAQEIRVGPGSRLDGVRAICGRYIEGLLVQGRHSVEGHRAFFHGRRFVHGAWWHGAAALALKNPLPWVVAWMVGAVALAIRGRRRAGWIPWIPAVVFCVLFVSVNRLAIGVRHLLPVMAFGTVIAAVWCARLKHATIRGAIAVVLVMSSMIAAVGVYPHYLSYLPRWAGGVREGHRWVADSNYDWGQELEVLEHNWAALTEANGGQPPHLVYFGFVDPAKVYGMTLGEPSLPGYMGRVEKRRLGETEYNAWKREIGSLSGRTAISVSAMALHPYAISFPNLHRAESAGRIGNCFEVYW